MVDHHRTTGGQLDLALIGGLDLGFDLKAREQRHVIAVELDLLLIRGHYLADETERLLVDRGAVDQHLADVLAQVVAHRTDDDVGFAVDQEGGGALDRFGSDRFPHLYQIVEIPLQLFRRAADPGGTHDHAHLVGQRELAHGVLELAALIALDAPRDTAGTRVVGHQHQEAPGQADEGGQRRTLVAALLLVDLDDDFLSLLEHLLDIGAPRGFLGKVLAGDLLERQKAVTIGAEVDEGGFQAGFQAGDLAPVDVGLLLLPGAGLDVQIVEALAIDEGDAQLFRLGRVDQHSFHDISQIQRAGGRQA